MNCENLLLKRGSKPPGQWCHVVAIDFVLLRRGDWLPPSVTGSPPHTEARLVQLFQRSASCSSRRASISLSVISRRLRAGGWDRYFKLLQRPETPQPSVFYPPPRRYRVYFGVWLLMESIIHLSEAGLPPRERERSGFIIGSLDPCLSPIDLFGRCSLSSATVDSPTTR